MNNTERYITDFYLSIGVDSLNRLNMAYISEALGLMLYWDEQRTKTYINGPLCLLIIDKRLDEKMQLEGFYHEIAHVLLHHSATAHLQLHTYFEGKADNLIPLLATPLHLLDELDWTSPTLVYDMSEKFNVTHEMALKRVEQIKDNLIMKGVAFDEGFSA